MSDIPLQEHLPGVSRLVYGCMGIGGDWDTTALDAGDLRTAEAALEAALAAGIDCYDHADIYKHGKAEQVFGDILKRRPELREQVFLQSKGGIRFADGDTPGRYDFSRDWIIACVEGSLRRLNTDYLDLWLLHRPDPLMRPEEVALAVDQLRAAGKVRYFGVSNMHQHQMEYLQQHLDIPLAANQLEMGLHHLDWLEGDILFNQPGGRGTAPGAVDYCRSRGIQLQAWASLAGGLYSGRDTAAEPEAVQHTAALVAQLAQRKNASREAIVLAWLLRHPARIQPVIGTTSPGRIRACAEGMDVELSREEWYALYVAARGAPLP